MNNLSTSEFYRNPNNTNEESVNSTDDWQRKMAYLVGFDDDLHDKDINKNDLNNDKYDGEIASINSDEISTSESQKTRPSLASNPFTKVVVVGTGTLIAVTVAGVLLSQMMGGGNNQSSLPTAIKNNIPETQLNEPNPQAEIELLKTKLALSEQAKAVKLAQMQLRTLQSQPQISTPVNNSNNNTPARQISQSPPQTAPRVIIQRVPTPAPTVYIPKIVTVEKEKIVRVPQLVASQPVVSQPRRQVTPKNPPSLNPPSQNSLPTLTPTNSLPIIPNTEVANIPKPQISPSNRILNPEDDLLDDISQISIASANNSTSLLQKGLNSQKIVPIGTSIKGVLAIALFGESQKSPNSQNDDNTFVIRLNEPLKTRDGNIALPAGTELLTQISNISDAGMLQLQAKSAIVNRNGKLEQITLPENAIRIRSPQGKPLIAQQYPKKAGKIAGMDTGLFALGAISKIAELSNRTDSEIITTAGGNIVTQNNDSVNILTGALEGGTSSIVPQISARNQQAVSEMMRRGNIWFLAAGTPVEIFVNQILEF
ncbi:hypothetical protein IQ247_22005 [Plectonema cf. radiosum LEGE 06105]|uniref:Uncharacterized protein n=1 Tax=Plectonema cf. radiosum LEGE 06105 TaxID=945769 RepID=A0A8J7K3H9_9CYAN|nr:TrbI/VirB10 family protein [Plectonema radiosum]MBE9215302.1 hypothetical protein [Plectonema cf. radiosum LEGE 06105]